MNNYQIRIKEAIDHWEEDIAYLIRLSDAKLERKLEIIRLQMDIAERDKKDEALELLRIWEIRTIEARIRKMEQCPELDEKSEIEVELEEMERMDRELEERQRALNKIARPKAEGKPEPVEEEQEIEPDERKKPDQLKLF